MKIVSLVKSLSSVEQFTFETKPALSVEVSTALGRLKKKDELLQPYEFDNKDGLLVVRSGTGGKTIAFTPEFQKALTLTLDAAEENVKSGRRKKEEQEEKEKAIQDAAQAFGVPIIEAVKKPSRRLAVGDDEL